MIVKTPPMGWNSWNTFGERINEDLIKSMADAIVDGGYADAGYNYVVIDDIWAEKQRNPDGTLEPSHEKFPNGMKAVGDYIHSKGLKFGMYSCAGNLTCAGYPASYEYEFLDAKTFASWGVDFLKYDYCYRPKNEFGPILYSRMGMALANCGRDILFSACSWGADNTHEWIKQTGAHMWRSTGDIMDNFGSVKQLYEQQIGLHSSNGQGCFNDMDMLIVGIKGRGIIGLGGCTLEEYKTHFSIWCMFGSPLMIGCDLRDATDDVKAILLDKDIIAIDQDPLYRQPFMANWDKDRAIWCKQLEGGDLAIGLFNMSDGDTRLNIPFSDLGLNASTKAALSIYDLWNKKDLGVHKRMYYSENIPAHGCIMLRCKIVDE